MEATSQRSDRAEGPGGEEEKETKFFLFKYKGTKDFTTSLRLGVMVGAAMKMT